MKIHENKDKRINSKPRCSYCREEGHNQYECGYVEKDWASLSKWRFPLDKDGEPITRGWFRIGNGNIADPLTVNVYNNSFTAWFNACRKAYIGQQKRKNKAKTKKAATTRVCGFCGGTDHTRRNCKKQEAFLADCYAANKNWREAAYIELVKNHGISVGACVKVSYNGGWNSPVEEAVGIITSISWDTINVFSALDNKQSDVFSPLEINVMVNGNNRVVTNVNSFFSCVGVNGNPNAWYHLACNIVSIITPAEERLSEDWIDSYKESFETLTKKRSLEELKKGRKSYNRHHNLVNHIDIWKD